MSLTRAGLDYAGQIAPYGHLDTLTGHEKETIQKSKILSSYSFLALFLKHQA